ncbi:MAG: hypothetical protein ABJP34_00855 [Erythrobacter sp.]
MDKDNESYRKHLEFAQSNIARMASASFAYKSWMIAIVSAVYAAYAASGEVKLILVAIIPLASFWLLDAFHLAVEKNFRTLYDDIRLGNSAEFKMTPEKVSIGQWISTAFSKTIIPLYLPLLVITVLAFCYLMPE